MDIKYRKIKWRYSAISLIMPLVGIVLSLMWRHTKSNKFMLLILPSITNLAIIVSLLFMLLPQQFSSREVTHSKNDTYTLADRYNREIQGQPIVISESGIYIVGESITAGTYNIIATEGAQNRVYSTFYMVEMDGNSVVFNGFHKFLGTDDRLNNVPLRDGDSVELMIGFSGGSIVFEPTVGEKLVEENGIIELKAGNYIVGKEIPEGKCNLEFIGEISEASSSVYTTPLSDHGYDTYTPMLTQSSSEFLNFFFSNGDIVDVNIDGGKLYCEVIYTGYWR